MLKLQRQILCAALAFTTVSAALLSVLPAMATEFDSTVTEVGERTDTVRYRWEVTNSETGEVVAYGFTKSKRRAKKKGKEKEEEFEEISGGSVVADDDFGCEILDAGNPECG